MDNLYSPLKILHHLGRIHRFGEGLCYPVFFQIDPTNRCNFNCSHCSSKLYDGFHSDPKGELNLDMLKHFLLEGQTLGLKALEITGGGEPTQYSHFSELINFIRGRFEFAVVTNGSSLYKQENRRDLWEASWVRISIDAATKEAFAKVHGVGSDFFPMILNGARALACESPNTILGFSFLITEHNWSEIMDAAKLAKEDGFSNIRFSTLYTKKNKPSLPKYAIHIYDQLCEVEEIGDENFTVFPFRERVEEVYQKTRPEICYYSQIVGVMAANGNIYKCCALKNEPGQEIGHYSEGYASVFVNREETKVKTCPPCWMDSKNEVAAYLMNENALHVNFP